jgi:large subunit ribosomal protein L21
MYAVVRTGGKQLRVRPGDAVRVEKLEGSVGNKVELSDVLLIGGENENRIGNPLVQGARVIGTITSHGRGEKLTVFKFKRRKNYRRKQGHTELKIEKIETGAKRAAKSKASGDD